MGGGARRGGADRLTMRMLVTGASGFVGRALAAHLAARGHDVVPAVRRAREDAPAGAVEVGEVDGATDWRRALAGVDAVVHLAARVHVLREEAADPPAAFRAVNVEGTAALARAAAAAGARRLVFLSSVGVNGGVTHGRAFTEADPPRPHTPYARSKLEAEGALAEVARETGVETVVVRAPLVHGAEAPANFRRLLALVRSGLPLPFASVRNRRTLVGVDNLCAFLALCLSAPAAAGETFLVGDGEDVSTPALVRALARGMGRPARLVPFPPGALRRLLAAAGRGSLADQLLGSLQVDDAKARRVLGWTPPVPPAEGLQRAGRGFAGR